MLKFIEIAFRIRLLQRKLEQFTSSFRKFYFNKQGNCKFLYQRLVEQECLRNLISCLSENSSEKKNARAEQKKKRQVHKIFALACFQNLTQSFTKSQKLKHFLGPESSD